jgi:hypothetical protein
MSGPGDTMTDYPALSVEPEPEESRTPRLVDWAPRLNSTSTLLGYATVSFGGWVIHAIPVFRSADDGSLSAGSPSIPKGPGSWEKVVTFDSGADRKRWTAAVLMALAGAGIGAAPQPPAQTTVETTEKPPRKRAAGAGKVRIADDAVPFQACVQ